MTATTLSDAPATASPAPSVLMPQQQAFFETFGYLVLPGLLRDESAWISQEFDAVLSEPDGSRSTRTVVPFIDSSPRLMTLLDHPRLEGAVADLLGEGFNYVSGDGAYRPGDTPWHPDGCWPVEKGLYAKVAIYCDTVTRSTGALRVIPGSHRVIADQPEWTARLAGESEQRWGIRGDQVPAIALESTPGDVVIFNHNTMHSSWGGSVRRMFTLNVGRRARTETEILALREYLGIHIPTWGPRSHGERMIATASPRRMRHLEQVIEQEPHVPALVAKAAELAGQR